jgi:lipopolysaccharide heptosyltransferase I
MPGPRILFVKLSSLGDVVHHLPAASELLEHLPDAVVDWAVEEAYVDLVQLHPGVARTFAVNLRATRRHFAQPAQWQRLLGTRRAMRGERWDYVVDTQGLVKSGVVARFARGPVFGPDAKSARERLAARFYDVRIAVPRALHAVDRNRLLVGEVFGYAPAGAPRYGLAAPPGPPPWAPAGRYAVLLHAASRAAKRWPEERWIALARHLADHGCAAVFPGGSAAERSAAARLAAAVPGALAAPPLSLADAAALLAHGALVAGVDTGLTHLAAALGRPTLGIYCATDPALTGLQANDNAINVGSRGKPPGVAEAIAAIGLGAAAA